jgi:hypothetical protein
MTSETIKSKVLDKAKELQNTDYQDQALHRIKPRYRNKQRYGWCRR